MRHLIIFTLFVLYGFKSGFAQNVGIGTSNPDPSAALDIVDSSHGLLIPRMTMVQRNNIVNPANGLLVYQTDSTKGFWYISNGQWKFLLGNSIPSGTSSGEMLYWNGFEWLNVPSGIHGQGLYFCDGKPTWGGCSPLVTTDSINSITQNTAISGGRITNIGTGWITESGVCWSTTPNPTISLPTKTNDDYEIDHFVSNITGLLPNTTYYVRAYATNQIGTSYGNQITFTTLLPGIATIKTVSPNLITGYNAKSGGVIITDGGDAISFKGVCWSTSPNPTTALSTKTNDGTGPSNFISSIQGLTPGTTYHVRAYAVNSFGTAYGGDSTFTTAAVANLPSVTICSQVWASKNLDVTTYRNGDVIPQVTDTTAWGTLTTGAWCWYNNDSATYASTYGKLYNWYAVNDPRGLAPVGWHIPTHAEWTTLQTCLGGNTVAGGKLKAVSPLWQNPNTGATNESGFTALPNGERYGNTPIGSVGLFTNIGYYATFWCATASYAWELYWQQTGLYNGQALSKEGRAVRCVKD